ncbi:MAG: DNA repair protein RecO [Rhizobiaceae bacterium]|nr:DNA repair protein RecO [Rhizobiaceae bacterium]
MEWTDEAIVLGVRKHGETTVIAELMTRQHGRHLGLVQGGRSRRMRPVLQPGNSVRATWRARLDEHLGQFKVEPENLRAAHLMENAHAIYALQTLASHLRLLPERDAHTALYQTLAIVLDNLEAPDIAAELVVRFELAMLDELGFGLDLSACAASGSRQNLVYVSPKTGRAVGAEAGRPWADRMLMLPTFLLERDLQRIDSASLEDIEAGFLLTHHFFWRHIHGPRGIELPPERASLLKAVSKHLKETSA